MLSQFSEPLYIPQHVPVSPGAVLARSWNVVPTDVPWPCCQKVCEDRAEVRSEGRNVGAHPPKLLQSQQRTVLESQAGGRARDARSPLALWLRDSGCDSAVSSALVAGLKLMLWAIYLVIGSHTDNGCGNTCKV